MNSRFAEWVGAEDPVLLQAVAFDFDLTLADSTTAVVECSNHALTAMGFDGSEVERVRCTIGLTLPRSFRDLTGRSDPDLEAEYSRRFVDRANEIMTAWTDVYPGVPETLASLRRSGIRLAIVSTKYRDRIEAILARSGLSGAIDVVVGGEDVREHKPHPEGLLRALSELGVAASRALYVGDHPVDAEAAGRAAAAFVAVRTGASPSEVWRSWAPLAVIADVSELPGLLASGRVTMA